MAKVFDLSDLLDSKRSIAKLGDIEYEISNAFDDILKLDELSEKKSEMTTREFMVEFLTIAFGKAATKDILSKGYTMRIIMSLINTVEKAITEESIIEDSQHP